MLAPIATRTDNNKVVDDNSDLEPNSFKSPKFLQFLFKSKKKHKKIIKDQKFGPTYFLCPNTSSLFFNLNLNNNKFFD